MIPRAKRATLFALYQLTIVIGIMMMPLALATHRVGVTLPIDRLLSWTEAAYEASQSSP